MLLPSSLCKQERSSFLTSTSKTSRGFNRADRSMRIMPLLAAVLSYTRRESRVW